MKLLVIASFALGALSFGSSPMAWAGDDAYEIQKTATPAAVGVPGKASLTVHGKNGWHVNEQAPITVTAKADPGVELPKPKLVRGDLTQSTKDTARFDIPFTAAAAGKKTITAEAKFVMCQEQACKPMKETVTLAIDVADAAPAGATPAKAKRTNKSKPAVP
ncbi:MAG: hypothetical protein H7X95_08575 [Deltaproteobacteria bacterium]|nr:hypothetical protein [Deltaproteobacteria bacterium]